MAHKFRAVAFALLLVVSSMGGVAGATTTATVASQTQVQTCDNPTSRAAGAVIGHTASLTDSLFGQDRTPAEANPCIKTQNIADADTFAEAKRIIAQEALEDKRYFESYKNQFETYSGNLENPAYSDARITYVEELANGSDKVSAVTSARRAAHARTSAQQHELWTYYNAMADSVRTLENKAEDKGVRGESIRIGYYDGDTFHDGYTFQSNTTASITVTNGSKLTVPAPALANNTSKTIHPLNQKLLVEVYNPEKGTWVSLINSATYDDSVVSSKEVSGSAAESPTGDADKVQFVLPPNSPKGEIKFGDTTFTLFEDGMDHGVKVKFNNGDNWFDIDESTKTRFTFERADTGVWQAEVPNTGANPDLSTPIKSSGDSPSVTASGFNNFTVNFIGDAVSGHTHTFREKHQTLEQTDNDVMSGLGTSSDGYLNDVYSAYSDGQINVSDMLTNYDETRITPDAYDTQAFQDWMRSRLGLGQAGGSAATNDTTGADGTTSTQTLVKVSVQSGATVNGETISSSETYTGASLWSTSPPPSGQWSTNTTYKVSEFGSDAFVGVNYQATETYREDGSIKYRSESRSANILSGTFTIKQMQSEDGTVITNATHEDRNPSETNVSAINDQLNDLEQSNEELRNRLENQTAGAGAGGAAGGGIDIDLPNVGGLDLGSIGLPFDSLAINLGAVGMVLAGLVVVLFVAGPTGSLIALIWRISTGGGKAAEKVAGLTNARERGLERFRDR